MRNTRKVGHPLFVVSVCLLMVNDWYLKAASHNALTGKLSDFAGLFVLPFLLSIFFPRQTIRIHLLTGLAFIVWKSSYSQPFITLVNSLGIPIRRTIDFSDYIALLAVFFSYLTLKSNYAFHLQPVLHKGLICTASLACMATSLPPHENRKFVPIDKKYAFYFSKRELVSRLNMVQIKYVREINKVNGLVDFNSSTQVFHYHGHSDTLALLLDYEKIKDQDTIVFRTSFAEITISGNETNSNLTVLSVYKFTPSFKDKDYKSQAIKQFEKRIIKKIKHYR